MKETKKKSLLTNMQNCIEIDQHIKKLFTFEVLLVLFTVKISRICKYIIYAHELVCMIILRCSYASKLELFASNK